ncbi:GntR family transcriptional regulator [Lacticaseibacillus daqingensis]|uniref:GntR family transcriptional regulator n=1 Tax=Lacticaseibacillus daqingensis TaxID=2486014 RepID=UPI000F7991C6|nr:GntR family transcriptional regulator [Lacticaseibacillus daqingensis]
MQPKYQTIKQDIVKAIQNGEFKPGERIFSEIELRTKYGVSSTTAVRALNELVNDGYLVRHQGEGTFVRRNLNHQKAWFTEFSPVVRNASGQRLKVTERSATQVTTVVDTRISTLLGDPTEAQGLTCIHQVAYANDIPWKFQDRYILGSYLDSKAAERLESGSSLSREMRLDRNMADYPTQTIINIQALAQSPTLQEEIQSIGAMSYYANTPSLFYITKTFFGPDHQALAYLVSYDHPDYYYLEVMTD